MTQAKTDQIVLLLQEGLDFYGEDRISEAILVWREVLSLDPGNVEAKDFIQTSDRRKVPRPEQPERTVRAVDAVLREARELGARQEYESALDLLTRAAEADLSNLEIEAGIELMRSRLLKEYRSRVGDLDSVPELGRDPMEITEFNLSPDAGFILSMVDGDTSLNDLISLSGMDVFDLLRTMKDLIEREIIRMRK
ncbi:MAG: hypothetical protein JRG96_03470 [Deltaproteobacteria bacterium]|nr:hypothetical protein [Deltaproteobacteria bacterium]MBW2417380.1 hypothetical protein [Deltaproteobacteria bacterium]